MKKFTQFAKFNKVNEQEITLQNNQTDNQNAEQNKDGVQVQVQFQPQQTQQADSNQQQGATASVQQTEQKNDPSKFFSKLFESREMAHVYHLQVKGDQGSYAAHIALGDYYTTVLDLIDELIETYQGQYDLVSGYDVIDTSVTSSKDKLEYFKEVAKFITDNKYVMLSQNDSHLQNTVDEILANLFRLIYKLRFNK